ncbi:MAG: CheB methylesterase domain-containing protein [Oscillospiraceae bacterium]
MQIQHTSNQVDIKSTFIIAIGASTGGTDAIEAVVKNLPCKTPGIVIVQHMPPVFTQMYAQRLNKNCKMRAKEAVDGDIIFDGQILIAPGGKQLEVKYNGSNYYVHCYGGSKVSGHCPSVDVLFHSVAKVAPKRAIGIILTGMGKDGADGLLHMRKNGSFTIGQDEKSSVIYGMPMVAYEIGAIINQVSLSYIDQMILAHLRKMEVVIYE